uniref:Plastocyanin-like domain-containing protein n=1 Tax=Echinococcus granulosus TaxID=6210 RepID=A0A068W9N2_ECHGR|nr:hypothetical protein EgrG_002013300 [Echinococcus granulosus]
MWHLTSRPTRVGVAAPPMWASKPVRLCVDFMRENHRTQYHPHAHQHITQNVMALSQQAVKVTVPLPARTIHFEHATFTPDGIYPTTSPTDKTV